MDSKHVLCKTVFYRVAIQAGFSSLHSPEMTHMQLSKPSICHLWIANMEASESQKH